MSHRVIVNSVATVFPTLAVAQTYARTCKGAVVEPGGTDDASFSVTKCGSREEEEAKRVRARYALAREREAEAHTEAGTQARIEGASVSDALDVAAIAQNVGAAETPARNLCACGKTCAPGMTACYTCRRYA